MRSTATQPTWTPGPAGQALYGPNGWRLEPTEAGYAIISPTDGPVGWAPFSEARERAATLMESA